VGSHIKKGFYMGLCLTDQIRQLLPADGWQYVDFWRKSEGDEGVFVLHPLAFFALVEDTEKDPPLTYVVGMCCSHDADFESVESSSFVGYIPPGENTNRAIQNFVIDGSRGLLYTEDFLPDDEKYWSEWLEEHFWEITNAVGKIYCTAQDFHCDVWHAKMLPKMRAELREDKE